MSASRKSWLSSFPFPGRSSHAPPESDPSYASSAILPNPALPLAHSIEKDDIWADEDHDAEDERKTFPGLRSRPLFDRAMEESPLSSPTTSDLPSDDDDFESPLPLHHSHPTSGTPLAGAPLYSGLDYSQVDPGEARASSPDAQNTLSRTPSLVPTLIASRPASPRPHSCVAEAEALGIKVRDFAYEEHGIPLARPVPDIETLKGRYQLYRSAELTPPADVVDTLHDYDEAWLTERKQFFDDRERMKASKPANSTIPWIFRRVTASDGFGGTESAMEDQSSPDESCAIEDPVSDIPDSELLNLKRDRGDID